jgi:hypothetical protein
MNMELKLNCSADFINKCLSILESYNKELHKPSYKGYAKMLLSVLETFFRITKEEKVEVEVVCVQGLVKTFTFEKDNYEIDMDEDGNLYQFILPFYSSLSIHFEGAECEKIKIADIGFSLIDEKVLVSIAEKIVQKTVDKD